MNFQGRTWLSAHDYLVPQRANFKGNTKVAAPKPVDPMKEAQAQMLVLQEQQR